MRKNIVLKILKLVLIILLIISGIILLSERFYKISFIENMKKIMNLRGNYS